MGIDNIPNTLNLIGPDGTVNYDRIETFSASDYAVMFSYARNMNAKGNFSVGGNLKVINRTIGSFATAWGFGADIGAQWRGDLVSFGLSIRDVTTTFNLAPYEHLLEYFFRHCFAVNIWYPWK